MIYTIIGMVITGLGAFIMVLLNKDGNNLKMWIAFFILIGVAFNMAGLIVTSNQKNALELQRTEDQKKFAEEQTRFANEMRKKAEEHAGFEEATRLRLEETLLFITGGDGFVYLNCEQSKSVPIVSFNNDSKYPVRDVQIEVLNMSKKIELEKTGGKSVDEIYRESMNIFPVGTVEPNPNSFLPNFPFPSGDAANYVIFINALNGKYRQFLSMKKINSKFVCAYSLFALVGLTEGKVEKLKEVKSHRHTDPGFPRGKESEIDWVNSKTVQSMNFFVVE
jgi:hypothetical protein